MPDKLAHATVRFVLNDPERLPTNKALEKARTDTFGGKLKWWPHDSVKGHGATSKKVCSKILIRLDPSLTVGSKDGEGWLRLHPSSRRRRYGNVLLLQRLFIWLGRG